LNKLLLDSQITIDYSRFFKNYKIYGDIYYNKKNLRISGKLDYQNIGENIKFNILDINLLGEDLKSKLSGNILINKKNFKSPFIEGNITLKDISYKKILIPRILLKAKSNNQSNILISIHSSIGKNYIKANGEVNLVKMLGNINGHIYLRDILNEFIFFSWNGNFISWNCKVFSQGKRLKGSMSLNSSGEIKGNVSLAFLKGKLNFDIYGEDWKYTIHGKGENLEKFIRSVDFEIKNNLSFNGRLILDISGSFLPIDLSGYYRNNLINGNFIINREFKGKFSYNFKNEIKLTDILYNEKFIGNLDFDYLSDRLNFMGEILGRKIKGNYTFGNNFNVEGEGLKIDGKISDAIYLDNFYINLSNNLDLLIEAKIRNTEDILGNFKLSYNKEKLGSGNFKGSLNNLSLNGEIMENNFSGFYSSNIFTIFGEKLNFNKLDIPLSLENWEIKVNIKENEPILQFKGNSYGFYIYGEGKLNDNFDFLLSLDSSFYKSRWKGILSLKTSKLKLDLLENNISDIIGGNIVASFEDKDFYFSVNFNFLNKGYVKVFMNSKGIGKIESRDLPLNFIGIPCDISLLIDLKDYDIEKGELSFYNFLFFDRKINGKLEITKENQKYKFNGDILNLSKGRGEIIGNFTFEDIDININLPDIDLLFGFIPKEFIINKNLKMSLKINGNTKNLDFKGSLLFSSPLEISYLYEQIFGIDFNLKYKNGKIFLDSLNFKNKNSEIIGSGEILPDLNLVFKIGNLSINVTPFLKGYIEGDINLKNNIKEPLLEGKISIFNSTFYFPQENKGGIINLPKIKLSLNLIVKDNVYFYIPNSVNLNLRGSLKIEGETIKPLISGRIDFNSGNIIVLNRIFSINYGYIKFLGLSYEENIWEIWASSLIQNYLVFLKAYGFMGQSSVYFSSDPPLSLKEILFLLLGQKDLAFAKEESLPFYSLLTEIPIGIQSFISSIFSEYILNPMFSEISRILNIESIRVQYTLESFVPSWNKILLEKKLGENIILRINYPLNEGIWGGIELDYLLKSGLIIKWFRAFDGKDSFYFEYGTKF
jgi:translocation and assembly module TamB